MITSDRNVGIMAHIRRGTKEAFRKEAARRKIGMSELLSDVLEEWLITAPDEQIEVTRSNIRSLAGEPNHQHKFDANGNTICGCEVIHEHTFDANGRPTCGCQIELPL